MNDNRQVHATRFSLNIVIICKKKKTFNISNVSVKHMLIVARIRFLQIENLGGYGLKKKKPFEQEVIVDSKSI